MNKFAFYLIAATLGLLAYLIHQASLGDNTAIVALSVIGTVILILFGAAITMTTQYIAAKREGFRFEANTKENFALIQGMQRVQNEQNSQLMKQVKQLSPPAEQPQGALFNIDEGIFQELED